MKELELEFSACGFHFQQLLKSDVCYLYSVNDGSHYEVFLRKEQQAGTMTLGGVLITLEAKIKYPNDEAFGIWAWTYTKLNRAMSKFNFINRQYLCGTSDMKLRMDFRFRSDVVEFLREQPNMTVYLENLVLGDMGRLN
jgi:hypothetical protein